MRPVIKNNYSKYIKGSNEKRKHVRTDGQYDKGDGHVQKKSQRQCQKLQKKKPTEMKNVFDELLIRLKNYENNHELEHRIKEVHKLKYKEKKRINQQSSYQLIVPEVFASNKQISIATSFCVYLSLYILRQQFALLSHFF